MKRLISIAFILTACGSSDAAPTSGTGGSGATGGASGAGAACSESRAQLLGSIDEVSNGAVTVLSNEGGIATVYVDATAGGTMAAASNPWTFITLADTSKVEVSDRTSINSTDWDLALKRPLLYTNDGDGGPGHGGAVLLAKAFDDVSAADATDAEYATEKFFDDECNPIVDLTGTAATSFSSWYDYDPATHVLSPAAGTWLVRSANGKPYKLEIRSYYATPDGGMGLAGGAFLLRVGAL